MSVSIDDIYNKVVEAALERHCSPSTDEHTHLLRGAFVKKELLSKALEHRRKGLLADIQDQIGMKAPASGSSILDRFAENCNWLNHLNGPEHNIFAMDAKHLGEYGKLDASLRQRFADLHAREPEAFEDFLREHVDEIAGKLADKHKANDVKPAVSWASRLVRDEAGKLHGGKIAILAAGGAAAGVGAVALLNHHREAPPGQGR